MGNHLHQQHLTLGEMLDTGNRRQVDHVENLVCRFSFGVHNHGNAQVILHFGDLLSVAGISHPRHSIFYSKPLGDQAGKDIQLIVSGQRDDQIGISHVGCALDVHTRAVPHHAEHIITLDQSFHLIFVFINYGNGMGFAREIFQNGSSDGAKADNHNFHRIHLLCRNGLRCKSGQDPFSVRFVPMCHRKAVPRCGMLRYS